jgi:Lrp/AsnC family transcriptional regulator for asnA, asnC and gidA
MIDETDLKLIEELRGDGRATYATLATKLGVSKATVSRKIDRLIKDDALRIIGVTDPKKIGNIVSAMIALNVAFNKIDDVCFQLVDNPKVHLLFSSFGRYDVFLLTHAPNEEMLTRFIKDELSQIEGVKDVETFYIISQFKAGHGVFIKKKPA